MSEREHILLQKRREISNKIILHSLQIFYSQNENNQILNQNIKQIFNNEFIDGQQAKNIISSAKELIIKQLNAWKGVQRSKKTAKLFRDYFKISKNWWDQKKIEIISIHFWIPIINLIADITNKIGQRFFAQINDNTFQEIFCLYLSTLIFKQICNGMLKMANSRERLLIPAGDYVILYKKHKELPVFVKKLLCDNDQIKNCVENGKGGKCTRDIIIKAMETKYTEYESNYICNIHNINNKNQPQPQTEKNEENEENDQKVHEYNSSSSPPSAIPPCTSTTTSTSTSTSSIHIIMMFNIVTQTLVIIIK